MNSQSKSVFFLIFVISILGVGLLGITLKVVTDKQSNNDVRSDASTQTLVETPQEVVPIQELKGEMVTGFPQFPVYPGAKLEESLEREKALNTNMDLGAEWTTSDSVSTVMNWYIDELQKQGWSVEPPDDRINDGEQVAQISKGNLKGYIATEDEQGVTEIVANFSKN